MTPDKALLLLKRQTPDQRKAMMFALRLSTLTVDRILAGKEEVPESILLWLAGRYVMTADSDGYVLLPPREQTVTPMNACPAPAKFRGHVDRDPKPGLRMPKPAPAPTAAIGIKTEAPKPRTLATPMKGFWR